MSQLYHIDKTDRTRFLTLLCPKWAQNTTDPLTAITVGRGSNESEGNRKSLLYHFRCIWDITTKLIKIPTFNDYTPLWHNKSLPEFQRIPDTVVWSKRGVYLHHILSEGKVKTFEVLQNHYMLPRSMHYRFFQLSHAARSQFSPTPPPRNLPLTFWWR